ncbi:glycerophosphodiester phosphodiesterase family protein [Ferrimonas aestuarii]|uniref:glycerophosphodiester phosphodiesterase n=1 Tax=Ferrimonas aestuarii TaxID=2569539 RepID=A0A4U1BUX9_9GAMM|nr:glycerophosphodiester phosphodiesterase family protein [Ferrimonas aestuarii]TKB58284.1 glycerophosphodiester phosphodiesterase [Ferrimonas aestuarii]
MKVKLGITLAALLLTACDDDSVEVVEVEKTVERTTVETIEVPVIVEVPHGRADNVELGPRPEFLVNNMDEGELKAALKACEQGPFYRTDFSIGHRGAPMQYPEHTKESYLAAHRMGAGILECDVTFTQDQALVCRHSQCDLHTTTNILETELASQCRQPFTPFDAATDTPASAQCCTSDITLAQFKTLKGKMDAFNPKATTVAEYLDGTASWRTDLYTGSATLMTHAESIELFKSLGAKMTPELKSPQVEMPFNGFSQQDYADKLIAEYQAAGVDASRVWPQSFNLTDVEHWIAQHPSFGKQAVYLDGRYAEANFNPQDANSWSPSMAELVDSGVKVIAPPLWVLVQTGSDGQPEPSEYAKVATAAGLQIITWTLERSGPLANGGGWYYQSVTDITNNDGDMLTLLDVLAKEVGVIGVFSDWPATTSYYASCMGLPASL